MGNPGDPGYQYKSFELPSDIFNRGAGDVVDYNGRKYTLGNPGNGTRTLTPYTAPPPPPVDAVAEAEKLRQYNIKANQPAIQSLEASKDPLKSRYDNLISEINRREGVESNQQTEATAKEYARRGIPLSSGAYDQALIDNLNPIREYYTGQTSQAQTGLEQGISEIDKLVAQLQTGNPLESLQAAIQLAQLNSQNQQNAIQNALAERTLNESTIPLSQAQVNYYNNNKGQSSDYTSVLSSLMQQFGLF